MEISDICIKSQSERLFRNGIHSLLRQADAKGRADISHKVGHAENIQYQPIIL